MVLLKPEISFHLGVFALIKGFGCLIYKKVFVGWFPKAAIWDLLLHELILKCSLHLND